MLVEFPFQRSAEDTEIGSNVALRIAIGRGTYFSGTVRIHWFPPDATLTIGRFCSISEDVEFLYSGGRDPRAVATYPKTFFAELPGCGRLPDPARPERIEIGHDVWIGTGARFLPGCRVGHGSIVGAYAVVTGDVPPYSVVVGNPAREIRRRFDDETVAFLLGLGWWNLPLDRIAALAPALLSRDPAALRAAAAGGAAGSPEADVPVRRLALNITSLAPA